MPSPKNLENQEKNGVLTVALISLFGCASEEPAGTRQTSQHAVLAEEISNDPLRLFPSPGVVDVCFVERDVRFEVVPDPGGDVTKDTLVPKPGFAGAVLGAVTEPVSQNVVVLVEGYVSSSWGAATGLEFEFHRTCPDPIPSAYITIYYRADFDPIGGGQGQPGMGLRRSSKQPRQEERLDIQMFLGTSNKRTILHEFGHVLGLAHEWDHPDRDTDFDTCFEGSTFDDETTPVTEADYDSIMNYRGSCGSTNDGELTRLDRLVAEALYPKDSEPLPMRCVEGPCFNTGSGVVGYGAAKWSSSWYVEGILESALEFSSGGMLPVGDEFGLAGASTTYPLGTLQVRLLSTAGLELRRADLAGTAESSRAKHTAILLSAL